MNFHQEYLKRLGEWSDIQGHLSFLFGIASKSKVVVELGVRYGVSTAALLAGVEVSGGHLWSVDMEEVFPKEWKESSLWTFINGNDLDVASSLPNEIDFLFTDTSHTYDQTLRELELYGDRSKIIALHDAITHPVSDAINRFCIDRGGLMWTCYPHSFGLAIINVLNKIQ